MFFLILIFVLVPIAEIYVILQVGEAIGAPATIALLIADSLLGWYLMRSQGRVVWERFQATMQAGRLPHREVFDGVLVIFGGAFLITPGFLTDIIGFCFLLPPTRALIRRFLIRRGGRMFGFSIAGGPRRAATPNGSAAADWDVDGTAVETDQPQIER